MQTRCPAFIPFLLITALLAAVPLLAQETAQQDAYVQATWDQEWQRLLKQPTGVDTGGANLATSTKDLQPTMALSGLLGQSSAKESPGTVVYDLNFLIPGLLGPEGSKNAQLQGVVNTEPQVSDVIRNALSAAQRDDQIGKLKDRIGGLGDSALRFTYAPATRSTGRSFKQYKQWFDTLCRAAVSGLDWTQSPTAAADVRADKAGLTLYHQLINNQPQLLITAERKFRDPLVGPDELGVKVSYEWSPMDFNRSIKNCGTMDAACLTKYSEFVNGHRGDIKEGDRFSFSGEYSDVRGETVDPGFEVNPVVFKSVRKLILSLVLSRNFTLGDGEPVKADLEGRYENVSDDPNRQDRGVVSLTFTRMIGKMQAAAGIVYANHSEFLSDVNARLSAHIGLRIGMFNGTGSNP